MLLLAVGEGGVDLVGEDQQVVLLHHPGDSLQVLPAHDGPGGVVGVGQDEEFRLFGDLLLHLLGGEAEAVFRLGLDGDGHALGHLGDGHVADEAGLGDEHLVPGVDEAAHAQVDGLAAAHGHQDLLVGVVLHVIVAGKEIGDLLAQLEKTPVGGVAGAALFQRLDARLPDMPGGVEVGLSHRQGDHVLHLVGDVEKLPDARGLYHLDLPVEVLAVINHKGCSPSRRAPRSRWRR